MKQFKVGDMVIAEMQYGYTPVVGEIVKIWKNEYNVMMADVDYGKKHNCKGHHRIVPVKSLKEA